MIPGNEMQETVKLILHTSLSMDKCMEPYRKDYRLPEDVGKELVQTCILHCQLTSTMASWSGLRVFDVVQKHHYLVHSCYIAQWLNPRLTWCFKGEDYMHKMQVVLQSCTRGSKPHQVSNKAVVKILLGLHVNMSKLL